MKYYITALALLVSLTASARKLDNAKRSVAISIDADKQKISLAKIEKAIIKFKVTNTSSVQGLSVDKSAIPEYESPNATMYFKVFRCEADCVPYEYKKVSIQKMSDTVPYVLGSGFSFTYSFNLFELYKIQEPGYYKLVGYYRPDGATATGTETTYTATSNELEILVTP